MTKVGLEVEIGAGDTSGLDALSEMERSISRTTEVLEDARKTGALNGIKIDGSDLENTTLKLNSLSAQVTVLGRELIAAAVDLEALDKASPNYERQAARVAKLTEQFVRMRGEIESLPDALANYDNLSSKAREQYGSFGDSESAFRTLTGAVGYVGGGAGQQIEQLANIAAEFLAVGEALPLLKTGLVDITAKAAKAGDDLVESGSKIAAIGGPIVTSLTGITGGLAAFAGAAAIVLLPLAALAGALAFLNDQSEKSAQGTRLLIKEQGELFKILATGTQDEARAKLQSLEDQKKALEDQVATQRANLEQFRREVGDVAAAVFGDALNFGGAQEYRKSLQDAEKALNEVNGQIDIYNRALTDSGVIARTQAKALVESADAYLSLTRALKAGDFQAANDQIQAALDQRTAAEEKIAFLEAQKTERSIEQQQAIQDEIDAIKTNELAPAIEQISTLTNAVQDLGYVSLEAAQQAADASDIQARIGALQQGIDLQRQINDLVVSGSSEQFNARKDQIAREIEAINSILPELEAMAETSDDAKSAVKSYEDRLTSLNQEQDALTSDTLALIQAREREAAAVQSALSAIDNRIALETQAADLIREGNSEQVNARLQALDDEKKAIERQLPELAKLAQTSEEAAAKLSDYRERIAAINEETSTLKSDVAPAVRAREFKEAQDEILKTETETTAKIKSIRDEALKTLEKIEAKRTDGERAAYQDRAKKLDQITQKTTQRISELNAEYMKTAREELAAFQKEEKRIIQDQNNEKLRLLDDLHMSLLEAEEDNNVVAFIRAQRDAESKLKQMETDADIEQSRRYEDFMAEQAQGIAEHEAKIGQIQTQAQLEREAADAQFNEKLLQLKAQAEQETAQLRVSMAERIKAEQDALAERTAAIRQQYGLENTLMQERTKKRIEGMDEESKAFQEAQTALQQAAIDRQAKVMQEELTRARDLTKQKIDTEKAAFQQFFQVVNQGFSQLFAGLSQQMQQLVLNIMRSVPSGGGGSKNGSLPSGSSGSSGGSSSLSDRLREGKAYAEGGLITEPTIALMGENLKPGYAEAVINFKPSEGLPPGLFKNNGESFVFNGDLVIGSGMSATEVRQMLYEGMKAAVSGIKQARYE